MALKDPYTTLGVARAAPAAEIKKAYRRLAKKFHPDVNPGDKKAEERFKDLATAFEVLGDPKKRALWDEFGEVSLRPGFDEVKARELLRQQASGFEGMFGGSRGREPSDVESMFGEMFNQRTRAEQRRRSGPQPQDGGDAEGAIEVELSEAVLGAQREVGIERPVRCPECFGIGSRPDGRSRPCSECKGEGEVRRAGGLLRVPCPACNGTGRERAPCERCGGAGQIREEARLKVRIPPGVTEGSRIRLTGQGAPGVQGGHAGDLYLTVKLAPHPLVRVEGRDLLMDLPVTVAEAVRGGEVVAPTFEGPVKLKIPPGSQTGRKLRLRARGLPHLRGQGEGRGDFYVVLQVQVPPDSEAARAAAEALEKLYGQDLRQGLNL